MIITDQRPQTGILWMFVTGLLFVAMTAIVKYLGTDLPSTQMGFLRFALGLIFLIPMIPALRRARFAPHIWKLFGWRALVHSFAVTAWFYAMTQIPLAEVTAMNYLSPVYVTLGAAFFLGEKLALRRVVAIGVAILGALVILRPGFRELSIGHLTMLATTLLMAASFLLAKRLARDVRPVMVVTILSISVTIGLAPLALIDWVTPTFTQLLWLTLIAGLATTAHWTMTLALSAAPVAVTQPVTFLQLVWATLIGYFIFSESIDVWVIVGGIIIVSAVSFITWREAKLKRRAVVAAAPRIEPKSRPDHLL